MKRILCWLVIIFVPVFMIVFSVKMGYSGICTSSCEESLHDGSGNSQAWSLIAVDDTTKTHTKLLLVDGAGALITSGVGFGACSTTEVDVVTIAAGATGTAQTATEPMWFTVTARYTNPDVVYFLPGSTAPSATTGEQLLQADSWPIPAKISQVMFYNGAAAQATVSVMWCYN